MYKKILHMFNFKKNTMKETLERLAKSNIEINTVIDVGASNGSWSILCNRFFPYADYLLIEAQKEHEKNLIKAIGKIKNSNYVITAAGDYKGEIFFDASDLFGGLASKDKLDIDNCIKVPVDTIDNIVADINCKGPFLLKLDTHGFEVPIFDGSLNTLQNTKTIIIEVYNFKLTESSLRFHEMINYLENKGFRPVDIVDLMRRPKDDILWQMDMVFIKNDYLDFNNNSYN